MFTLKVKLWGVDDIQCKIPNWKFSEDERERDREKEKERERENVGDDVGVDDVQTQKEQLGMLEEHRKGRDG